MSRGDECLSARRSAFCSSNLPCQDEWGVYLSDAIDVDGIAKGRGRVVGHTVRCVGGRYKSHSVGNHIVEICGWTLYEGCIWASDRFWVNMHM